jgi:hypothetical protein
MKTELIALLRALAALDFWSLGCSTHRVSICVLRKRADGCDYDLPGATSANPEPRQDGLCVLGVGLRGMSERVR